MANPSSLIVPKPPGTLLALRNALYDGAQRDERMPGLCSCCGQKTDAPIHGHLPQPVPSNAG